GALPAANVSRAQPSRPRMGRARMHAPLGLLDPYFSAASIIRNHGYLVYDTLFATDAQGRPRPQMVEAWEASPDRLSWAFHLRPGLRFHDGQPVTAEDCAASLRRWWARDGMGRRLRDATAELAAVD